MTIGEFWQHVTTICHLFNLRVTSGPRSHHWNKSVGGVPDSYHLVGMAADLVPCRPEDKENLKDMAERLKIVAIDEGDHWHLQPRN